MNRPLRSGILGAAVLALSALTTPTVAGAAAAKPTVSPSTTAGSAAPTILARGDIAFLSGDPWQPSGPLEVKVINEGGTAAKGFFLLRLPPDADLTAGGDCRAGDGATRTWVCGGAELPAGGDRTYRLTVTSSAAQPVFGVTEWGSVAGRDATGREDRPTDFRINWPDRTTLRLRATAGPVVDGAATLRVRVTNTGAFDIGGYSLNVATPDGVRVTAPGCSGRGRMHGVGCEILRERRLASGATDGFDVRVAATGGTTSIRLWLAPTNRYTNRDTSVTLRLTSGGSGGGGATTAPAADPTTPATTPPATPAPEATELPRTGTTTIAYGLIGVSLLTVGGGLLLLRRRLGRD
ncbi:LPXTG cell wall anchor domain-containing protein [Micromonospora sp. NIE79]|uniref:LPXTG cell wall anchor domain-containing protein n=1 Tax=Micromonospora trifolii TaxID=2911208 RepID=A0ABS9N8J2_9ACTN|nr:LPXTG cell wall anchor domain-containing protein [Micromonospora trifolii]MCG5446268.1 LPXTG cell wall anchor domain-containing protein [Micromonospora trifolii]